MSRRFPTFKPQYFTVKEMEGRGIRIHRVEQYGDWAVIITPGLMLDTPNERGDHVGISSVKLKIRMG